MNKVSVKIVIGSNYGDEGKGMATYYFSNNGNQKCLNVLYNGGCQRGHTVELQDGRRHIFHHFGSGTYANAATYFDADFMVNPIFYNKERKQILDGNKCCKDVLLPKSIVHPHCRVVTPYDIFINQIVEKARGSKRHGSCGHGIWETQIRYEDSKYNLAFCDLSDATDRYFSNYLNGIANIYLPQRLSNYGINTIPTEYIGLITSRSLMEHYIEDFREMQSVTDMKNWSEIKSCFNTIVFEGGQGLALDENNTSAFPHVTASKTTSLIPIQRVKDMSCDIEICYVSRSYFTKHGAGELPTECLKTEINKDIEDRTNVRNYFQEEIRYGRFDINEFLSRVQSDISTSKNIVPNLKTSLLITHLNYTNDIAGDCTIKDLVPYFDKVYRSYSKYPEEIIKC